MPFSPVMSSRESVGPVELINERTSAMAGDSPMSCSGPCADSSAAFCRRNCRAARALRTVSSVFCAESGFSRKSNAPSLAARMADSSVAWPEIITSSPANPRPRNSLKAASPSIPGNARSTTANPKRLSTSGNPRASSALAQVVTE